MQDGIETRRKRAILRAGYRGMREADMILGPFAREMLPTMTDPDLAVFEALLEEADRDVLAWVMGQATAPGAFAGLVAALATAAGAGAAPGGPGPGTGRRALR